MCGDDADAKAVVARLVEDMGYASVISVAPRPARSWKGGDDTELIQLYGDRPWKGSAVGARSRDTAIVALRAQRMRTRELKLRAAQWNNLHLVFPNSAGRYLRADKVLVAFKRVLKSAGLPERRLHDLRHTYATDLYAADVHPRSVQDLLGHSRLDMTNDLCTGSVPDALREAVERLDRAHARQAR